MLARRGERFNDSQMGSLDGLTDVQNFWRTLLADKNIEVPLGTEVPITSETLRSYLPGENVVITNQINQVLGTWSGWQPIFAPLSQMSLRETLRFKEYPRVLMEQGAEDTPPPVVRHIEHEMTFDMSFYHMGAKFHNGALMTREGVENFQAEVRGVISSAWDTLKQRVIDTAINTKILWGERGKLGMPLFTGVLDATGNSVAFAYCLSARYNEKAFYKLNKAMKNVGRSENVNFTDVVLPQGLMDTLAFGEFETEVNRRGPIANDRLTRGGESMNGTVGIRVHEDEIKSFDNDPEVIYDNFSFVGQVGRFAVMDGTDTSKLLCASCDEAREITSIEIPDAQEDGWKKVDQLYAAKNDLRYDVDGERGLSDWHDLLLETMDDLLKDTRIDVSKGLADPFLYRTDINATNFDSIPLGGGYAKIDFYGDAELQAWTLKQNKDIGSRCVRTMLENQSVLKEGYMQRIERLIQIQSYLNTFNPVSTEVQAFFAAVQLNPENSPATNGYLKANEFGGVQPPTLGPEGILAVGPTSQNIFGYRAPANSAFASTGTIVGYARGAQAPDTPVEGAQVTGALTNASRVPFGFGAITGLRTLARLHKGGESRGYDKNLLREIDDGVVALDAVVEWLKNTFPKNVYTNESNVPFFIRSGNAELDQVNSIILSLFQDLPHPVMIRTASADSSTISTLVGDDRDVEREFFGLGNAQIKNMLDAAGFDTNTASPNDPLSLAAANDQDIRKIARTGAYLKKLLTNPNMSSSIRDQLLSNPVESMGKYERTLGAAYDTYARSRNGPDFEQPKGNNETNDYTKFAWFLRNEVFPLARNNTDEDFNAAASLLTGIFNLVNGSKMDVEISSSYLDLLKRGTSAVRSKKRDFTTIVSEADTGATFSNKPEQWVNSRLTSSDGVWRAVHDSLPDAFETFYHGILRPSNPTNTALALGGQLLSAFAENFDNSTNIGERENVVKSLQFARVGLNDRGTGILEQAGLMAPPFESRKRFAQGTVRGGLSNSVMNELSQVEVSGVRTGEFLPDSIIQGGELVDEIPYEDRFGRRTTEMPGISLKKNLIYRLQQLRKMPDRIARVSAILSVVSYAHFDNVEAAIDAGIPFFGNCWVLAQPNIRIMGSHGMWFDGVNAPGKSGYEYDNATLQMEGQGKTWFLNFNSWFGCTILNQYGYYITPWPIASKGYQSGWTTDAWTNPEQYEPNHIDYRSSPSMFIFNVGSNLEGGVIGNVMSLSGIFHEESLDGSGTFDQSTRFGEGVMNHPSALIYNLIFGFYKARSYGPDRDTFSSYKTQRYNNQLCHRGKTRHFNPSSKVFDIVKTGHSHLDKFPDEQFMSAVNGSGVLTVNTSRAVTVGSGFV